MTQNTIWNTFQQKQHTWFSTRQNSCNNLTIFPYKLHKITIRHALETTTKTQVIYIDWSLEKTKRMQREQKDELKNCWPSSLGESWFMPYFYHWMTSKMSTLVYEIVQASNMTYKTIILKILVFTPFLKRRKNR